MAGEWAGLLAIDHPGVREVIEVAAVIEGGRVNGGIDVGRVKNSMAAYLCWMAPRIIEMRRVLKPNGSLYLHSDDAADSYLRLLLDVVFGRERYRNSIVWKRTAGRSGPKTVRSSTRPDSLLRKGQAGGISQCCHMIRRTSKGHIETRAH